MPFDQFVYADLKPYGEHQQLRLVFVTHEVSVRGDSLERIENDHAAETVIAAEDIAESPLVTMLQGVGSGTFPP